MGGMGIDKGEEEILLSFLFDDEFKKDVLVGFDFILETLVILEGEGEDEMVEVLFNFGGFDPDTHLFMGVVVRFD
jgi:hypothetical protein